VNLVRTVDGYHGPAFITVQLRTSTAAAAACRNVHVCTRQHAIVANMTLLGSLGLSTVKLWSTYITTETFAVIENRMYTRMQGEAGN
jgi:uncharacterized membrane protein (DUF2068 family)